MNLLTMNNVTITESSRKYVVMNAWKKFHGHMFLYYKDIHTEEKKEMEKERISK